jgi:multicomponent Na+:H+ antiporter subunit C
MSDLAFVLAAWLFFVGLYGIVTSRDLIHAVICLSVFQSSTYVLLIQIGYRRGGTTAIFLDVSDKRKIVDPVVQALTLTDVVVGVTVMALLLALILQVHNRTGTIEQDDMHLLEG